MNDLEKYLKGEPLNEDLRALRDGDEDAQEPRTAGRRARRAGALDDDDREHLRALSLSHGWQIVLRLLDQWIEAEETSVKELSLSDPLGQRDQIANSWAYVACMRRVRNGIPAILSQEIEKLNRGHDDGKTVGKQRSTGTRHKVLPRN